MREHLRSLIEQARQEAGSRMNRPDAENATNITEALGRDAVRLARLAAAVHMQNVAMRSSLGPHLATGTRPSELSECAR
jgi:hypothetical protein